MILHQTLKKERRKGRKHTLSMNDVLVRLAEKECQQIEEALYAKSLKTVFIGER